MKPWLPFSPRSLCGSRSVAFAACLCASAGLLHAAPEWLVVRGQFFDLYSNAGKSAAIDAAVSLEQFRRVVGGIWKVEPASISRARIVQFRTDREFEAYGAGKYSAGFFSRNEMSSVMAFANVGEDSAARELVQHECVHWLIASKRGTLPTWINEGVAELYSTFRISGNRCFVFEANPSNLRWLQQHGLGGLEQTVVRDYDNLDYNDAEQVSAFYAQSWALVHYLVCGVKVEEGGAKLRRYLELTAGGTSRRDAFEPAFGEDFAAIQRKLGSYVNGGRYYVSRFDFARDQLKAGFTAEPAPAVEVECALALAHMAGTKQDEAAELRYIRAKRTWPDSPLPYEGVGIVAMYHGDYRAAERHFGDAVQRGTKSGFARYFPASMELHDRLAGDPAHSGLQPADARRLSDQLRSALELDRTLSRAPDELGVALLFTEPLRKADVQFLADLAAETAQPAVVYYRVAGLLHRMGDKRAKILLENLTKISGNDLLRAHAEAELTALGSEKPPALVGAHWVWKSESDAPGLSGPIVRPKR